MSKSVKASNRKVLQVHTNGQPACWKKRGNRLLFGKKVNMLKQKALNKTMIPMGGGRLGEEIRELDQGTGSWSRTRRVPMDSASAPHITTVFFPGRANENFIFQSFQTPPLLPRSAESSPHQPADTSQKQDHRGETDSEN